ncbi:carbohydrate-binding family 9-like protein [Mucilaginibacter flavus]|uniref:carbohydrate-binding family 9-like protein n=1 Tax=Mucilaginibacter flavus TaxID=931504 RepID=UPI0025B54925|nr:carbohydrate-binding family 9-like protein [Mucilaginibacter flavus]MDN3581027.1 carbohydrate-binding family 9-like protein [Mucilaginibacter flavus]
MAALSKLQNIAKAALMVAIFFTPAIAMAQSPFGGLENLFNVPQSYVVRHIAKAPVIDGDINDAVWQQAKWTNDFVDIEGDLKPKPTYKTNVKMLWDDSCLYVAARMSEPQVWATLKNHDDIVYHDNDFELFIEPGSTTHNYYEIEVNAYNTIFDLFLNKPYRNRGGGLIGWDAKGLRSAVKIQGTLNNTADRDEGWTVEMAIPFKAITMGFNPQIPKDGTIYRLNFSRVEYDAKIVDGRNVKLKDSAGRDLPEHNWSWSPQGEIAMHSPEHWGYLLFSTREADDVVFKMPYSEEQKKYLWLIYYREKLWYKEHHEYTSKLSKLGIESKYDIDGKRNTLRIEATKTQFAAFINTDDTEIAINHEGFIEQLKPLRYE